MLYGDQYPYKTGAGGQQNSGRQTGRLLWLVLKIQLVVIVTVQLGYIWFLHFEMQILEISVDK
jgi:hypothetical protein